MLLEFFDNQCIEFYDISVLPEKPVSYNAFKSIRYACQGIYLAFSREINLTVQLCVGIIGLILGILTDHTIAAMGNLIMMGIVISLELINSSMETLCDVVTLEYNQQIKEIKDMSAGAVLVSALIWLIIFIYILLETFLPNLLNFPYI